MNQASEWIQLTPHLLRCAGYAVAIIEVQKLEPNLLDLMLSRHHNQVAQGASAEFVLGHRDRFVNDECRAPWVAEHVLDEARFQCSEDQAAVAFVRLVQVPQHHVGIGHLHEREGLGILDRADGHPRPLQVVAERPAYSACSSWSMP